MTVVVLRPSALKTATETISAAGESGALGERGLDVFQVAVEFLLIHRRSHVDARGEAVAHFEQARALQPKNGQLHFHLAQAYCETGQFDGAVRVGNGAYDRTGWYLRADWRRK